MAESGNLEASDMSPTVHDLPHDVIREIFRYFAQPLRLYHWHKFPWFLGHISSEWRHIFLSMIPEFWSKFKLKWTNTNHAFDQRHDRLTELVAFFLSSGRGHPFSFKFTFERHYIGTIWRPSWNIMVHILTQLIEQSMRWHDVLIMGPDQLISQLVLVRNRLPLLRRLELPVFDPPKICDHRSFESAPSLTHIKLSNMSTWNFQWATLTSFIFESKIRDSAYFLHVLSQMNNLEELEVKGTGEIDQCSNAVIIFPHLIRLTVFMAEWLNFFEAPSLKHLAADFLLHVKTNYNTAVVNFFRRSRCPLLRLEVYDCQIPIFMTIAQYAPTIVQFGTRHLTDLVGILRCLTHREEHNGDCALPRLQSLRIQISDPLHEEQVDLICSLVAGRGRGVESTWGRGLQTLFIEYPCGNDIRTERILEVCEGLNVKLVIRRY